MAFALPRSLYENLRNTVIDTKHDTDTYVVGVTHQSKVSLLHITESFKILIIGSFGEHFLKLDVMYLM